MEKVAAFLKEANECLKMPASAKDETVREQLIELGRKWTELATERERLIRQYPNMVVKPLSPKSG